MYLLTHLIGASAVAASLVGCGGGTGSGEGNVVKGFNFSFADRKANFEVQFSQDFTLSTEITSPIGSYGSVAFVPGNSDYGFKTAATLDVGVFLDKVITETKVNRLPNNAPFPSYIGSQLSRFTFVNQSKFAGNVYLGFEAGKRYLGTAIALNGVTKGIPAGVALSQSLFNDKNERVGVATVYGPSVDANGNITAPGGLFGAVNLSTVVPGLEDKLNKTSIASEIDSFESIANQKFVTHGQIEVWTADGHSLSDEEVLDFMVAFKRAVQKSNL